MMKNTLSAWIAKYPVKLGMALQWFGSYLMGASAIFQAGSGEKHWWVFPTIVSGFFITGIGGFIALLFTNGRYPELPPSSSVQAQTVVQTILKSSTENPIPASPTQQPATP